MEKEKKKRAKTGGRVKGTKNKRTEDVIATMNARGFNPIEMLIEIAVEAKDKKDVNVCLQACKELAQYVAPKRKAIEMTAEVTTVDLADDLTDTQRENLKKLL